MLGRHALQRGEIETLDPGPVDAEPLDDKPAHQMLDRERVRKERLVGTVAPTLDGRAVWCGAPGVRFL